jgi:hypothetical protein
MALAYELGQRLERIIAELGGVHNPDITQEELEAKAAAYGVAWQVVSYAIGRELSAEEEAVSEVYRRAAGSVS